MTIGIKVLQSLNPTSRGAGIQGFVSDPQTNAYSNHNENKTRFVP